jgi:sugar transferase EpsL
MAIPKNKNSILRMKGLNDQIDRLSEEDLKKTLISYQEYLNQELTSICLFSLDLHKNTKSYSFYKLFKRIFDLVVSVFLLVLCAPIFLFIYVHSKLISKSDVFFRQWRVGHNFEIINIYKFQTMSEVSPSGFSQNKVIPLSKSNDQFRITKFGAILRKWKIDELPQLLNVVRGEMSLIGPRPLTISDSCCCPVKFLSRFGVKPGLTGLWQANFPNTINYKYKFKFDSIYAQKYNFFIDTIILLKTPFIVLKGESELNETHTEQDNESKKAG